MPAIELDDPRIIVRKGSRRIDLIDGDRLVKPYKMVLGFSPTGDKQIEGDGRTPEGEFFVCVKNPKSKFHLSLGLSYPGREDAERGLEAGLISQKEHDEIVLAIAEKRMPLQKTMLGGEIYIHGGGTSFDWTEGCLALDNDDMAELFEAVPIGTRVTILP